MLVGPGVCGGRRVWLLGLGWVSGLAVNDPGAGTWVSGGARTNGSFKIGCASDGSLSRRDIDYYAGNGSLVFDRSGNTLRVGVSGGNYAYGSQYSWKITIKITAWPPENGTALTLLI